jgi:hypothetical protein
MQSDSPGKTDKTAARDESPEKTGGTEEKVSEALTISVSSLPVKGAEIPLQITFTNTGKESLRILDAFSETDLQRVFLHFKVVDSKGLTVATYGGGKVDFGPTTEKDFATIEPEETFDVTVDLNQHIGAGELAAGRYDVSVAYQNQYGRNCFVGRIQSKSIFVQIDEK